MISQLAEKIKWGVVAKGTALQFLTFSVPIFMAIALYAGNFLPFKNSYYFVASIIVIACLAFIFALGYSVFFVCTKSFPNHTLNIIVVTAFVAAIISLVLWLFKPSNALNFFEAFLAGLSWNLIPYLAFIISMKPKLSRLQNE